MMFLKSNLCRSLNAIGVQREGDIFERLEVSYGHPSRHYHTSTHISECLTHFSNYRGEAEHPAEVEVAIWFHDAVYDTMKNDNEEQSAAWARNYLSENSANLNTIERIEKLILSTKTHSNLETIDQKWMVDIDLCVLGQSPERFEAYDQAIREEYIWVPEDHYRKARSEILRKFLKSGRIYSTEAFIDLYEKQARINLAAKIRELEA